MLTGSGLGGSATALEQQITVILRYPAGMAERIPRAPADAEARQVLELLRNSWMLVRIGRAAGREGR
jgi:hypothetical protein